LHTGILPKGKKHIARLIDGVINEMVMDLGGEQEITASQKIIIANIRQLLVFLGLVNEWILKQPSIINKKGDMLSPLSGFYLAASNSIVRNCERLGMKRIDPIDSLEKYLASKASATATIETPEPSSKRAGAGKKIDSGASSEVLK